MTNRSPTTKDVALLHQLYQEGQLLLAPEFQRNSIWPQAAKAYLIDTILNDRPIPLIYLQRARSAQTGKPSYSVIDGQQRLRAIFAFIEDRLRLTESKKTPYHNKKYSELPQQFQEKIQNYDLIIDELSGYSEKDIRDIFIRMNKYVVKLAPQELRHAKHSGEFYDFVEAQAKMDFWKIEKVFTATQLKRMKAVELCAELIILLIEGPQDKKASIDLYYEKYKDKFTLGTSVARRLKEYLDWILASIPNFNKRFIRKPVDFYALIGALDEIADGGKKYSAINKETFVQSLLSLERQLKSKNPSGEAARYFAAASRQTDNLSPRQTRIEIMSKVLRGVL